MRGFFLVFALIGLLVQFGCGQMNSLPAVPITLNLKSNYKSLEAGPHKLMLGMTEDNSMGLFIYTADLGVEVFSISREALSIDTSFPTLDETLFKVKGVSADGVTIEGEMLSLPGIAWDKPSSGGHGSCYDVRNYHLKANLTRNGELIGTISGSASRKSN